jgi:hypothetical protein
MNARLSLVLVAALAILSLPSIARCQNLAYGGGMATNPYGGAVVYANNAVPGGAQGLVPTGYPGPVTTTSYGNPAPESGSVAACDDCACDVGCLDGCEEYCGPRWRVYGDFLYLRPADEKVAFAVPINGAIEPPPGMAPVQVGMEGVVDCDYDAGFRVGGACVLNDCSEIGMTYTFLECDTSNQMVGDQVYPLRSLVDHPGAWAAPTDFLTAEADLEIDLDLFDIDYRHVLLCGGCYRVSGLVGARYAHLDQTFGSVFTNSTLTQTVDTAVRFDGGGIRVGIEGERRIGNCGLMVYGSGVASFVGGEFRGRYAQADSARGLVVNTGWNEDRVVSILDLEVGVGWSGWCDRVRVTAGYMFSGWFNPVITDEFIDSVRVNNSVDAGDSLSFDGLVLRSEVRF